MALLQSEPVDVCDCQFIVNVVEVVYCDEGKLVVLVCYGGWEEVKPV